MILIIDNYDSFTYNLVQYVGSLTEGEDEVKVVRNDDKALPDLAAKADKLIFSPGPGWPVDAGLMEETIKAQAGRVPMLGICLGFQAIVEVFGGKLRLAKTVMHGKESQVRQMSKSKLFANLEPQFQVMRYHSIVMDDKVAISNFAITGLTTDDGEIMGIESDKYKIYGLQFHPESIGTPDGLAMIENFLKIK